MATVGESPSIRPPSLKNTGTILAAPSPNRTNPTSVTESQGLNTRIKIPNDANRLPPITTTLLFSLLTNRSPCNLITAIATENAAYPIPVNSGDTPLWSRKNIALQSNIAPSDRKAMKHIRPSTSTLHLSH